jgi:hypothetical protein
MSKIRFHRRGGKHRDILQSEWLENIFLEIIVERKPSRSFNKNAGPVNVDSVFPTLTGLEYERLFDVENTP